MTVTPNQGPLSGVRVVDLTNVIMGPYATHILADMGADVVKVESAAGDSLRGYRPARSDDMSGAFMHLNRNKRSIVLDLKSADGRAALDRLLEGADVFVHALRPKAITRLGYSPTEVRALNPEIIYCGAYGFSVDGPYADKAAYDDIIQAGSGIASISARVSADGEPAFVPTVLCDKLGGQAIAYAILAALFAREKGAGGQDIEVPMFETSIEFMMLEHMGGFSFEPSIGKPGFSRILSKFRKPFRTSDGHCCILPYSDRNWQDFYDFVGCSELAADPKYSKLSIRVQNIDDLYALIEKHAAGQSTADWVAFCDRKSIPCMPVLSFEDIVEDSHVKAVKLFQAANHPTEGAYKAIRSPIKFSGSEFSVRRHAPKLGQHTIEILNEIGMDAFGETAPSRE
ncbi:Acetyl-CoA:oxalate CoA-transferase [Sulfitobacter sp. DSM 110093]|uniref:CaiB/BaiF CoA transferase family protein n=1 Tax=Sulfitobacter sp. DSM 110093 TaxID=2883127 RepID=UPI001FAD567E|nr:CoA transferase [Sulfitobacter sp. DSM 110093]UOA33117.1 Acetyl-CoA:oxalate CoA-transferase [Sulfitobacter sp. DSM 110093]